MIRSLLVVLVTATFTHSAHATCTEYEYSENGAVRALQRTTFHECQIDEIYGLIDGLAAGELESSVCTEPTYSGGTIVRVHQKLDYQECQINELYGLVDELSCEPTSSACTEPTYSGTQTNRAHQELDYHLCQLEELYELVDELEVPKMAFSPDPATPNGSADPSEVLVVLKFRVENLSLKDVLLEELSIELYTTDNANTDWNVEPDFQITDTSVTLDSGTFTGEVQVDYEIPACDFADFELEIDAYSASASLDDSISAHVVGATLEDEDANPFSCTSTSDNCDLPVNGGTLNF